MAALPQSKLKWSWFGTNTCLRYGKITVRSAEYFIYMETAVQSCNKVVQKIGLILLRHLLLRSVTAGILGQSILNHL